MGYPLVGVLGQVFRLVKVEEGNFSVEADGDRKGRILKMMKWFSTFSSERKFLLFSNSSPYIKIQLFRPCVATLTLLAVSLLTLLFALTAYCLSHTLEAPAAVIAGAVQVTALVGIFCVGLIGRVTEIVSLLSC
jgi:hypothetical protein